MLSSFSSNQNLQEEVEAPYMSVGSFTSQVSAVSTLHTYA